MKTTRVIVMSDIHYCRDGWYGVTQEVKRERICADLEKASQVLFSWSKERITKHE